jgi:uncharacterized protein involved in exopolysaccharide biosynthesis
MNQQENLLDILKILLRWKRPIIIIGVIAFIGACGITLMLPNYYKAATTFYSASPDLAKPAPIGNMEIEQEYYGEDEDVDRVLSIANSGELAGYIIDRFKLYEHYEINPEGLKAKHKVQKKFFKLYNAEKTKFDGIEVSMEDTDPELARDIANAARDKINEFCQRMVKESQDKLIATYQDNIESKMKEIFVLNDSLLNERKRYQVWDTVYQGQVLSEQVSRTSARLAGTKAKIEVFRTKGGSYRDSVFYYGALIKSLESQMEGVNTQLESFNSGLPKITYLEQEQKEFSEQLSLDKERYKQLRAARKNDFTALHIVDVAETPVIKSRPKRSILVLSVTAIVGLLSLIAVFLLEKYKAIDWKSLKDA